MPALVAYRMFQHTAARRRLENTCITFLSTLIVSTHSRPKAAGCGYNSSYTYNKVSTHSRPKAAGSVSRCLPSMYSCFNTQPPEGGWISRDQNKNLTKVSTHSRPKAAGTAKIVSKTTIRSFNTQPPEGGW